MAVNGFLVDNEVQKYNYESLENYNTLDFSSSSTYQVGDYVMYQGKLYKCITEITTSGAWDSTKWSLAILSDDVANLKRALESSQYGLSESIKQSLLQIARKIAYIDDQGQTYYNTLYNALYPPADLSSITATYTQSGTVYDTDTLDSLKTDLVVTAHYSDSSTQTVPAADYTLSGSLTEGTSTITVSYGGKTTTFNVTVEKAPIIPIYEWDLTQSLTDKIAGLVATTTATQGSSGLVFNAANQYADFGAIYQSGRTYELDVLSISTASSNNRRILMADTDANTGSGGCGFIFSNQVSRYWAIYTGSAWATITGRLSTDVGYFNGKTIRIYVDSDRIWHIYCKDTNSSDQFVLFGTGAAAMASYQNGHVYIGGNYLDGVAPATFTGFRVYDGEIE